VNCPYHRSGFFVADVHVLVHAHLIDAVPGRVEVRQRNVDVSEAAVADAVLEQLDLPRAELAEAVVKDCALQHVMSSTPSLVRARASGPLPDQRRARIAHAATAALDRVRGTR